jgi:hypothetical protein
MNKNELIKLQKIDLYGEVYEKTLSVYLDIVEHFIFIGDLKAARSPIFSTSIVILFFSLNLCKWLFK